MAAGQWDLHSEAVVIKNSIMLVRDGQLASENKRDPKSHHANADIRNLQPILWIVVKQHLWEKDVRKMIRFPNCIKPKNHQVLKGTQNTAGKSIKHNSHSQAAIYNF